MSSETIEPRAGRPAVRVPRRLELLEPATRAGNDVVVHADPVGAAYLMKELVARRQFDAALEEEQGNWRVVVRGGPREDQVVIQLVDLVARCIDEGSLAFATLCVGQRTYTMSPVLRLDPQHEPQPPAAAA